MAFKALFPIGIMVGAMGVAGRYTGESGKERQYHEHSLGWETGLRQICGVLPPRTHVDPFIAKPHPVLEGREIPVYNSGAFLSQVVPGSKLDPYANPYPTPEQFAKERKRLLAIKGTGLTEEDVFTEEQYAELAQWKAAREAEKNYQLRNVYRSAPMAEYYRVQAYAKLHPELEMDEEKIKSAFDVDRLKHMR